MSSENLCSHTHLHPHTHTHKPSPENNMENYKQIPFPKFLSLCPYPPSHKPSSPMSVSVICSKYMFYDFHSHSFMLCKTRKKLYDFALSFLYFQSHKRERLGGGSSSFAAIWCWKPPSFVDLAYVKILHAEGKHHKLNKYMWNFPIPHWAKKWTSKEPKFPLSCGRTGAKWKFSIFHPWRDEACGKTKDLPQTSLEGMPFKLEIKSSFFSVSVRWWIKFLLVYCRSLSLFSLD